jgi:hypothetical protein
MVQYSSEVRPGKYCGIKLVASDHATRENTIRSVKWRRIGIPLIRPIWMDTVCLPIYYNDLISERT